jgi:hypothetical protein
VPPPTGCVCAWAAGEEDGHRFLCEQRRSRVQAKQQRVSVIFDLAGCRNSCARAHCVTLFLFSPPPTTITNHHQPRTTTTTNHRKPALTTPPLTRSNCTQDNNATHAGASPLPRRSRWLPSARLHESARWSWARPSLCETPTPPCGGPGCPARTRDGCHSQQ